MKIKDTIDTNFVLGNTCLSATRFTSTRTV